MGKVAEQAKAEVLEVFEIGFADFAEEEALEARVALAIVSAHLGEEPEGFAAAAGAAVADGGGAVVLVAEAGGGAGGELFGLEDEAGIEEVADLVRRALSGAGGGGEIARGEAEAEDGLEFGGSRNHGRVGI